MRLQWLALSLGTAALAFLVVGLAGRWRSIVGLGLIVLGAQYAVLFGDQGRSLDEATPAYAGGFLLVAELAYWSLERRVAAWTEQGLLLRRLGHLLGVCFAAAALAAVVLVAAASGGGGGVALEALGAAAAVGAVAVVALLVRRSALR
jgi:hypothetical protein